MMQPKDLRAKQMEDDNNNDVIVCLSQNLFDHVNGEQRIRLLVGLSIEQDWGCRVRRKRKSGKGTNDNVNPKQLNGAQYWFFLRRQCPDERDDDGRNVGCDMELKNFAH